MTTRVTASRFTELGLDDWRVVLRGIQASFRCGTYASAGAFAADVAQLSDAQDHHAALNLRYPDLLHIVSTTHFLDDVTDRDVTLATSISNLAREKGFVSEPTASTTVEIAIDALDIDAVRPFWKAVLGYVEGKPDDDGTMSELYDPRNVGPAVWFQRMDEPRDQRNRIHLDVVVPHDAADERLAAALDAGGHMVSDAHARAFWVLADAEGNEACICTWQDRGR
ncbi:MAG TPA: VOC family protein [Nocardioidaceae bacterium]|nr:VOC family protein [Nocardioidaceae bacterium]